MKPASPSKQIDQSFQCVPCSQAFPILPQLPHNMKWMVPIPNHQSESSFLFRGGKRDGAGSSARASCTRRPRSRASRSTELVRYRLARRALVIFQPPNAWRRSSLKRDRGPFYWCGGWGQIKRAYYNDESRTKGPWFVAMLTGNGGETTESTVHAQKKHRVGTHPMHPGSGFPCEGKPKLAEIVQIGLILHKVWDRQKMRGRPYSVHRGQ